MAKKTAKKKVAKKKVAKKTATRKTASRKTSARKTATSQVQDYAHEIWLAGLGAFSMAQQEGNKLFEQGRKSVEETSSKVIGESNKLFDRLVKEGGKLEGRGRKMASDTVSGVRGDVESRVGKVRDSAQSNWDKLEKVFEQRVARALSRLGVPTSDEIKQLSDRVAELNKQVRALSEQQKKSGGAAKKTASKPADTKSGSTSA
ncbi:phasin family protein [Wenzhouxiangella sediminis]|jgi:poly(hydroxyalkanoate) granule-associated protein|uniref:Polygranule-associated protein n=1 Tax=Wenzhouxiangella sediminis TaxID=1792836 RepID=A0A3E1KBI7_9GAMM|nr:phasin family protein [Wenzhouxiangella sediminis]MEE4304422.1 phasin family protein [Wenzhouxiangella sp.]RFF31966.1 polygranule-associated protein [Wenzhouxiangella sediminis]